MIRRRRSGEEKLWEKNYIDQKRNESKNENEVFKDRVPKKQKNKYKSKEHYSRVRGILCFSSLQLDSMAIDRGISKLPFFIFLFTDILLHQFWNIADKMKKLSTGEKQKFKSVLHTK